MARVTCFFLYSEQQLIPMTYRDGVENRSKDIFDFVEWSRYGVEDKRLLPIVNKFIAFQRDKNDVNLLYVV